MGRRWEGLDGKYRTTRLTQQASSRSSRRSLKGCTDERERRTVTSLPEENLQGKAAVRRCNYHALAGTRLSRQKQASFLLARRGRRPPIKR
jgi:hypothetical protein